MVMGTRPIEPFPGVPAIMPITPERWTWEKWAIGALSTLAALFFSLYVSSVQAEMERYASDSKQLTSQMFNHEQRLTTLEENKRNIEQLLTQIQRDLEDVKRAVTR